MSKETAQQAVDALLLSVYAEFVPFSQSRNAGNKDRTLNWRVTLHRNGRPILTTDYSAGMAHAPSYKTKVPANYPNHESMWKRDAAEFEAEFGRAARYALGQFSKGAAIAPVALDVIYSLVMDSEVLDCGTFEEWAGEFGYDADSRKAESIYRACLEIALQLRNGVGESGLATLREAFQDY